MAGDVTSILIVGVGGQGTLLASRVIADVVVAMGYDVKVSEVHGMAQRGGSVVSQVRFGSKVYSPIIKKGDADIILGFEKLEAARWLPYLKEGGVYIINDERIDPLPVMSGDTTYPVDIAREVMASVGRGMIVPATQVAEECGNSRAANIVLVGLLAAAMKLPQDLVEEAVRSHVPAKALEVNLKALARGREIYNQGQ